MGDEQRETTETGELRESFSMWFNDDHKFPFVEDENANITGYGHQDKAAFAAEVNRYDEVCNGEPYPEDEQWDEDCVGHYWVVIAPDGETLQRTTPDDPDAIPVTGLWGQR